MEKPVILVTNDDGIFSKGIRSLVEVLKNFGEIVVVAPDKAQSGMGTCYYNQSTTEIIPI